MIAGQKFHGYWTMPEETSSKVANVAQANYWNSEAGRKWVKFQEGLDTTFAPVSERLWQRARPATGDRVLDIGCGTGATTLDLAARVGPEGKVIGIDISDPLLQHAEDRLTNSGIHHIQYQLADAQTHRFDANRFDLFTSRFGTMFFENPSAAFANLATALRPGCRLVFVSWAKMQSNPWFNIPGDAAVAQLGKPTPSSPTAPGPLAFASIDYVVGLLQQAGFAKISGDEELVELFNPGTVEEVASQASNIGPSARIVKEYSGTCEDVIAIGNRVSEEFRQFVVEEGVRIPARLNFFEAFKSA